MSQFNTTFSLPALIVKVDINGNVIEAFKGLNYNSTSYIMNVNTMNVLPDSSFLLTAFTTYLDGEFGVSNKSYRDVSLFMHDSSK